MYRFETSLEYDSAINLKMLIDNPNDPDRPRIYIFALSQKEAKDLVKSVQPLLLDDKRCYTIK